MPRPFDQIIPIDERFWAKVCKPPEPDGCWVWTAFIDPCGYGVFGVGSRTDGTRRTMHAARWIYERTYGTLPPGHEVDHKCRNRACVRPDHLDGVTHAVNSARADCSRNGAWQKAKTQCPQGHVYDNANTARGARGERRCRECDRLRHLQYRRSKRQPN